MTLSVYEINPKEHPDAYHGLRVSVQFGGVHHQRYFNFRDKTPREIKQFRADAYALEENWLAEKIKAKIRFDNQANDFRVSEYSTGVRGIHKKLVYSHDLHGNNKAYSAMKFVVQGRKDGRNFCGTFHIETLGEKEAWTQAVTFYAKSRKLTRWKHLLKRQCAT